jgi:hypothetical protein
MTAEPENLILELMRSMRADTADMRAEVKEMRAELKSHIHTLRADVAADLLAMQARNDAEHKATRDQIVGLRRAVVEYHSVVIGHGVLISDPEERVRRLEQHPALQDKHS